MNRRHPVLMILLCGLILASSNQGAMAQRAGPPAATDVTLTYWGTAGWEITDGQVVILVDPYLSRLRIERTPPVPDARGDLRPIFGVNDPLRSDTAAIDAHLGRADFILVHHSHYDHLLDVPYIARKTGATVLGTESTINLLRASGVPESQLLTVRGGADYEFSSSVTKPLCPACSPTRRFSIRVIPSIHSALRQKHYYDSRTIPPDVHVPLLHRDYAEGGSLGYLIRLNGREILTFGGMNYIEREIEGLRPDVVIAGAAVSRHQIYDYAGRLMRALGNPPLVLPTHWDNFEVPFADPRAMRNLPGPGDDNMSLFVDEIRAVSPKTQVTVPKYFNPVSLRGVPHVQKHPITHER